jgi:PAS domain S-box-containing protein
MIARDAAGTETWLLSLPPTRRQMLWAVAVAVCQVVALAIVAPFAKTQLAEINPFIPAFGAVIFVTDLITSVLLFSQFAIYRLRALLVLACGYLFSALIIIPYALTFPGAFSPTGLLGAGLQTTALLYWFWHLLFPLALLGYGLMKHEKSDPGPGQPSLLALIVRSVAFVLALVCGLTLLATAGNDYLPVLFADRIDFTPAARLAAATTMLASVSAVVVLWLRRRSLLDQWLIIVALASLLEMALGAMFVSERFSLGFYAGRVFSLLTSTIVLVVLLAETMRFHANVARSKETKIRRLVDANILGICISNLKGGIVEANEAFLRMLQYSREDVVSGHLRWTDLTPADWREQTERSVEELRSTGAFHPVEKEYFRKDGSRVPVLVGGALFEKGGNEGVTFVLDLTERRRAEEALRESERSARSAIDGIAGLVAVLAPNGELETVNRQLFEYSGRSLEYLKNWGTNDVVHPENLPDALKLFKGGIASGMPFNFEVRIRRFDGEYRWFNNHGVPVLDDSGRIARWYVLLTDIDDRKQALARLDQMQSDFAHINRVSMMGELAASLSHEIAQPIASARNNARAAQNFLDMQPPDLSEVREALGCVVGDTDRAGNIIGRIRGHMKKAPPRKAQFDLNEAIDEVIVLGRSAIIKNRVWVQTRLSEELFPVHGDRVQLQQVVMNLLLNAVEAMGSVEGKARDLLISTEQNHTGVLVAVRDSGPGIDPSHLERVFDAFHTTKSGGMGMGLSICRSIIEAHGGRLWAEANEPRGTVFQFTLPSAETPHEPPAP